jgi:hypothetical protein
VLQRSDLVRVLLDGVGAGQLADDVAAVVAGSGRPAVRVRAEHFLRPAGERFEHGREDAEALRTSWLDAAALEREVLAAAPDGRYLPALRDPVRDRSARLAPQPLPPGAVVLVDGLFVVGRALSCELTVHLALSPAAMRRRGVPDWQLPAFVAHDASARADCDVLVLAEDPRRPAVVLRQGRIPRDGGASGAS